MAKDVCYIIVYVIEALIAWQFFVGIYVPKRKPIIQAGSFLLGYVLLFLISKQDIFWINIVMFLICNMLLVLLMFSATVKSSLFHAVVLTALMCATELIVLAVVGYIFSDFVIFKSNLLYLVSCALLSKTLYFLLMQIVLKVLAGKGKEDKSRTSMTLLLCIVPCVSLWVIINLSFLGVTGEFPRQFEWMTIASAILLLVTNLIIFAVYNYTQKASKDYLEMQLQLQKENADKSYFQMLSQRTEEQKILMHDINKHLNAIYTLIKNGEPEVAEQYIVSINKTPEFKQVELSDNESLNMLLSHYQNLCEEQNIRLDVDIRKQSVNFMSFEDITALFGNLLENAYEACVDTPEAYIDLNIRRVDGKNTLITMINTCKNAPREQAKGVFTTIKENKSKHGIGMKSIRKVVRKHGGSFKAYYQAKDRTFHIVICFEE